MLHSWYVLCICLWRPAIRWAALCCVWCVVMSLCHVHIISRASSVYSDSASHPAPLSSSPSRKPWETRPVCQSRAAWGRTGVSWRQTALRPCILAPPTDMAPPSLWYPPTSHRNQKLTLCLKPSYPTTGLLVHATEDLSIKLERNKNLDLFFRNC